MADWRTRLWVTTTNLFGQWKFCLRYEFYSFCPKILFVLEVSRKLAQFKAQFQNITGQRKNTIMNHFEVNPRSVQNFDLISSFCSFLPEIPFIFMLSRKFDQSKNTITEWKLVDWRTRLQIITGRLKSTIVNHLDANYRSVGNFGCISQLCSFRRLVAISQQVLRWFGISDDSSCDKNTRARARSRSRAIN